MKNEQGWTLTELIAFVALLGGFALICGAIYIGAHFIMKFW